MKALTPELQEKANEAFKAIYEMHEKMEQFKEDIKVLRSASTEMMKTLSEDLEVSKKGVQKGYKEWVYEIENPVEAEEAFWIREIISKK